MQRGALRLPSFGYRFPKSVPFPQFSAALATDNSPLNSNKLLYSLPFILVLACVIGHAGSGQRAAGFGVAADPAFGFFAPAQVEGPELAAGKPVLAVVGQVIVDSPGESAPGVLAFVRESVEEGRHDDAGGRAHASALVAAIPDMRRVIRPLCAQLAPSSLPRAFTSQLR